MTDIGISGEGDLKGVSEATQENQPQQSIRSRHDPCAYHKRPLLNLSPWCLVMVEWLFLLVPWGCLQFVIVVFPGHTHLLFLLIVLIFFHILVLRE